MTPNEPFTPIDTQPSPAIPTTAAPAPRRLRRTVLIPVLLAVLLALGLALPGGFVAAMGEFMGFYRAPADVIVEEGDLPHPDDPPVEPPTVATVAEAATLLGAPILTPATLPPTVASTRITVQGTPTEWVMIDYADAQGYGQLSLSVRRGPQYLRIGASAAVEPVQIGAVAGEYVQGGFIGTGTTSQWNSDFPSRTVSWRLGEVSYQLNSTQLSKEELLALAASMQ